jgi:GNAT superfamily N-acetyltransferase
MLGGMWRSALPVDDDVMVGMGIALNAEDPGSHPVPSENMRRTLRELRRAPGRGRAVVLELDGRIRGYALLISFWSNELGGNVCTIDELYVEPEHRGRGHATGLIECLSARSEPWLESTVGLALEATPDNVRARRFYERIGFRGANVAMQLRLPGSARVHRHDEGPAAGRVS